MIKTGLIGFGTVGRGLYEISKENINPLYKINYLCEKDTLKTQNVIDAQLTEDYSTIFSVNGRLDCIVELINSSQDGIDILRKAALAHKPVVTANKKMIAENLQEILSIQQNSGIPVLYEAAVCGSIPIIRILEEYYRSIFIEKISMICNGTTNYILSKIYKENLDFASALLDAQKKGFAERDSSLDINGHDARNKLVITLLHAYGLVVSGEWIFTKGISSINGEDITYAKQHSCMIRSIAFAVRESKNISAFVLPAFISRSHPFYGVERENNAVLISSKQLREQLFIGLGAGSIPTAVAVQSDIEQLNNGYRYSYHKQLENNFFSNDVAITVYVRSKQEILLDKIKFLKSKEVSDSGDSSIVIGKVQLSSLIESGLQSEDDIFIAALPEVEDFN